MVQLILFLGVKRQEREAGHSRLVRSLNFTRSTYLGMELRSRISYLTRILVSACPSLHHITAEVCCQKFNYSFACSIFNCQFYVNLISRMGEKKPSVRFLCSLWQRLTALGHYFHVLNFSYPIDRTDASKLLVRGKTMTEEKGKGPASFFNCKFCLNYI
jgi:hypothetical protein